MTDVNGRLGGTPPWHMWGQSNQLTVVSPGATPAPSTSAQLARVAYKRPDTFKFLLAATIVGSKGGLPPAPIDVGNLTVQFIVTVGIGLAHVTLDPFGRPLVFQWTTLQLPVQKWIASAECPIIDDNDPTPTRTESDTIVAQNIQVAARCFLQTPTTNDQVIVDLQAFFAPATHIRPDWYGLHQGEEFEGERRGR